MTFALVCSHRRSPNTALTNGWAPSGFLSKRLCPIFGYVSFRHGAALAPCTSLTCASTFGRFWPSTSLAREALSFLRGEPMEAGDAFNALCLPQLRMAHRSPPKSPSSRRGGRGLSALTRGMWDRQHLSSQGFPIRPSCRPTSKRASSEKTHPHVLPLANSRQNSGHDKQEKPPEMSKAKPPTNCPKQNPPSNPPSPNRKHVQKFVPRKHLKGLRAGDSPSRGRRSL